MRAGKINFVVLVSLFVLGVFKVNADGFFGRGHDHGNGHEHRHGHGHDQGHGHGPPRHGNVNGLEYNFYEESCPDAEGIVKRIIRSKIPANPGLPAKLIRMHFHDCFVRGCDGSVLLDKVNNTKAEKDAVPNQSLSGFHVIDEIKAEVEKQCPKTVSCADILALAARDAVSYPFRYNMWEVPTGRRDGKISRATDVTGNLPGPSSNFTTLFNIFTNKTLNLADLVILSGAHTIGVARCPTFANRLYNFTGKGDADPDLDESYAAFLRTQCLRPVNANKTVEMDPGSATSFDNDYFRLVLEEKGLFQSDAALLKNEDSLRLVKRFSFGDEFISAFAKSIVKMGAIQVLTGEAGEIRNKCNIVNP